MKDKEQQTETAYVDNPVFDAVRGKKLRHTLEEFGFPDIPETVFTEEYIHAFHQVIPELPVSHELTVEQLSQSLQRGAVVDVKTLADGTTVWTVSFKCLHYACTCQFSHLREMWEMIATPQVQKLQATPKWYPSSWFSVPKPAFVFDAAAVVLLVVVSFALGNVWADDAKESQTVEADTHLVKAEDAVQYVREQGHLVLTPEERNHLVTLAHNEAYEKAQREMAAKEAEEVEEESDWDGQDKEAEGIEEEQEETHKVLVFTMREGMPIDDLVSALEKYDFIKDKQAFLNRMEQLDLVTSVKVGDYEFTSGMNEEEILEALK